MRAKEFITDASRANTVPEWMYAEVFTEYDMHREAYEMFESYQRSLSEEIDEQIFQDLSEATSDEPVVGESYYYLSVHALPATKFISIAKFENPHELISIDNGSLKFNMYGHDRSFPNVGNRISGDLGKFLYVFNNKDTMQQLLMYIELKYRGDFKFNIQTLDSAAPKNFNENASVGGTSSGGIATMSMPLGGTIRRGGSLLAGQATDEEFPNTPEHIRKMAKQWKSSDKNAK